MAGGGKRAIVIAHRRWGKDEMALQLTCELAHKRVGSYWHCLPEYSQARRAIWSAVNPHTGKRRIDEAFPPELVESRNEQEMFIRFKNGSTWQLVGSDRYNSLVGAGVAGVVFSEWALANPSAWGYIRPMIEENDGWAIFITTPRGRNHAKATYDLALKNPEGWYAEVSSVENTKALTDAQLQEALEDNIALYGHDIGKATFDQEYLCSFNAATIGAFYAAECLRVRMDGRLSSEVPVDPDQPVHRAWDLGWADSTAIWWFQVVGDQVRVLDYYSAHHAPISHYADIIKGRGFPLGGALDFVPHDARVHELGSGRSRVETMLSLGLAPRVVARSSDADGHQAIRLTLPNCVFHTRTEELGFTALESYKREWDDDRKTFKQNALHDWSSHGAKAFQYLSQSWRAQKPQASSAPERPKAENLSQLTLDELWALNTPKRDRV